LSSSAPRRAQLGERTDHHHASGLVPKGPGRPGVLAGDRLELLHVAREYSGGRPSATFANASAVLVVEPNSAGRL
jgi:hypothetical protein